MDEMSRCEQAKYERMWTYAEYRGDHVTAHAHSALGLFAAVPGQSVIDFGAGAGHGSAAFADRGLRVLAIDIAVNAMEPHFVPRVPRLLASLWDLPVSLRADWGFCCDVMEHIPQARVADVLRGIRASTRGATYFCISLRPDGCGALIGEALHLTVEPLEWWVAQLRREWSAVQVVAHEPGERAVLLAGQMTGATGGGAERATAIRARMAALATRMVAANCRRCHVYGSGEVGQAFVGTASGLGMTVEGFVTSEPRGDAVVLGLPVRAVAAAARGSCHAYAIGSFASAPTMLTALEAAYSGSAHIYSAFLPEGPAPR